MDTEGLFGDVRAVMSDAYPLALERGLKALGALRDEAASRATIAREHEQIVSWFADVTEVLCGERPKGVIPKTTLEAAKYLWARVEQLEKLIEVERRTGTEFHERWSRESDANAELLLVVKRAEAEAKAAQAKFECAVGAVNSISERLRAAESESDAARQEAESQSAMVDAWSDALGLEKTAGYDEAEAIRTERDSLRERVANLEGKLGEAKLWRDLQEETARARDKARAARDAAEARVKELEARHAPSPAQGVAETLGTIENALLAVGNGLVSNRLKASYAKDALAALRGLFPGVTPICPALAGRCTPTQSTPAPGLLEAVGRIVPFLQLARRMEPSLAVSTIAGTGPDGVGPGAILAHADVDAVLAAYDAAKDRQSHRLYSAAEVRHQIERVRPVDVSGAYAEGIAAAVEDIAHGLGLKETP